jgi:hypothetical protein
MMEISENEANRNNGKFVFKGEKNILAEKLLFVSTTTMRKSEKSEGMKNWKGNEK